MQKGQHSNLPLCASLSFWACSEFFSEYLKAPDCPSDNSLYLSFPLKWSVQESNLVSTKQQRAAERNFYFSSTSINSPLNRNFWKCRVTDTARTLSCSSEVLSVGVRLRLPTNFWGLSKLWQWPRRIYSISGMWSWLFPCALDQILWAAYAIMQLVVSIWFTVLLLCTFWKNRYSVFGWSMGMAHWNAIVQNFSLPWNIQSFAIDRKKCKYANHSFFEKKNKEDHIPSNALCIWPYIYDTCFASLTGM